MDKERFFWAMESACRGENRHEMCEISKFRAGGIGTLNESPLHAVLKLYFEPRRELHELNVGGYIADIANEDGCVEIQTRNFLQIRQKLNALLTQCRVTLVYPVADLKWLSWIDPATGETTKRRKSPKRGRPAQVFYELYGIRDLIGHQNFRLCVVMLELEEFKYLNGWGADKKRNATRATLVPKDITDELYVENPGDLVFLLPDGLPGQFTSTDLQKCGGISLSAAQRALNILHAAGVVSRIGKKSRKYLYEVAE